MCAFLLLKSLMKTKIRELVSALESVWEQLARLHTGDF
jgi:hypothetical protein